VSNHNPLPATWPPLPEPVSMVASSTDGFFTADQMRAYAEQYAAMREAAPAQEPVFYGLTLEEAKARMAALSEQEIRGLCTTLLITNQLLEKYAAPVEPASQPREPLSEREAFEAWASAEGFCIHRDDSDKYRDYHRATTRWAWQAWQARARGIGSPGATQTEEPR
jgi:hypothetical protein